MIACVKAKGWTVNYTIELWYSKVYRPYISALNGPSRLLLDAFECHEDDTYKKLKNEDNAIRFMIAPLLYYNHVMWV